MELDVVGNVNRIVIFALTSVGIMLALLFLVVNIRYRTERYVSYGEHWHFFSTKFNRLFSPKPVT